MLLCGRQCLPQKQKLYPKTCLDLCLILSPLPPSLSGSLSLSFPLPFPLLVQRVSLPVLPQTNRSVPLQNEWEREGRRGAEEEKVRDKERDKERKMKAEMKGKGKERDQKTVWFKATFTLSCKRIICDAEQKQISVQTLVLIPSLWRVLCRPLLTVHAHSCWLK